MSIDTLEAEKSNGVYLLGIDSYPNPGPLTYKVISGKDKAFVKSIEINGQYIGGTDFEFECKDFKIEDNELKVEMGGV